MEETLARAAAVGERLVETFGESGEPVAIVLHADFKRKLISRMLDGSVDPARLGPLRNTGITKLDYDDQCWKLDWFNSVSHLPAELITAVET